MGNQPRPGARGKWAAMPAYFPLAPCSPRMPPLDSMPYAGFKNPYQLTAYAIVAEPYGFGGRLPAVVDP